MAQEFHIKCDQVEEMDFFKPHLGTEKYSAVSTIIKYQITY